jgi:hypothetical protein
MAFVTDAEAVRATGNRGWNGKTEDELDELLRTPRPFIMRDSINLERIATALEQLAGMNKQESAPNYYEANWEIFKK